MLARYFSNSPEFWLNLQAAPESLNAECEAAAKNEGEVSPQEAVVATAMSAVGYLSDACSKCADQAT